MADKQGYQVVGSMATFTVPGPTGPVRSNLYKGAWVPEGVPQAEIDHNVSVGLVAPVDDPYRTPVTGDGVDSPLDTDELGRSTEGAGTQAKAAPKKATAKDGELANLRERAVKAGMDKAEVDKASEADLRAALKE